MTEHEWEPAPGLPETLPEGEQVLWQGAPRWGAIARRAFHAGHAAAYFGALLAWRAGTVLLEGGGPQDAALAVAPLLPLACAAVAILAGCGWLVGRTTLYTITNRRVVMRIGVVLTVTFNLPFRRIESVALRHHRDGTGDLALVLAGSDRIAYLHLWPHVRPWRVSRPEPMLRALTDAESVAATLACALAIETPHAVPLADASAANAVVASAPALIEAEAVADDRMAGLPGVRGGPRMAGIAEVAPAQPKPFPAAA